MGLEECGPSAYNLKGLVWLNFLSVIRKNAGTIGGQPLLEHSTELFREIMEVNVTSLFVASREAAKGDGSQAIRLDHQHQLDLRELDGEAVRDSCVLRVQRRRSVADPVARG